MKHIVLTVLLTGLIAAPAWAHDDQSHKADDAAPSGYVLKPGEGEDGNGDRSMLIKASPKTGTQGAVLLVDEKRMPPGDTSGIHVHLKADEFFYVLEGKGRMLIGDTEHEISAGDTIFVPLGTDHRVTSSKDDPLRTIFLVDRPGLDEQFRLEATKLNRSKMTVDEFNAIIGKYGTIYKTFD